MAYIRNISGTYMNYIGNIYEIGYMGGYVLRIPGKGKSFICRI